MAVLGTVQPGESPGILNTGDITFGPGSMLDIELAGTTQGTLYDVLNSSGPMSLQNGSELETLALKRLHAQRRRYLRHHEFQPACREIFPPSTCPRSPGGESWDLDNLYQNGTLSVVPEPAALAMLLIALAAVACWIAAGNAAGDNSVVNLDHYVGAAVQLPSQLPQCLSLSPLAYLAPVNTPGAKFAVTARK